MQVASVVMSMSNFEKYLESQWIRARNLRREEAIGGIGGLPLGVQQQPQARRSDEQTTIAGNLATLSI